MTIEEKINLMRVLGDIDDDENEDTLVAYLNLAKDKLINHIYPYKKQTVELEPRYESKQVELAVILYDKRGADGEEQHNENGVNRKYISEEKFLASIPRKAGLPI